MYLRFPGLKRRGLWAHGSAADERGTDANRLAAYDVVRIVLGLVLLTAAASKGHQLATEPVAATSLFTSRWFLIGVVEFELFFGLWLLAGLYPRSTWVTALLCFGGFACVSLYKALSGEASCGCFGKVSVNPWYTLMLDTAAVAALLCWRPNGKTWQDRRLFGREAIGVATVAATWLLLGIPGALAIWLWEATMRGQSTKRAPFWATARSLSWNPRPGSGNAFRYWRISTLAVSSAKETGLSSCTITIVRSAKR